MPSQRLPRQPDGHALDWLERGRGRQLLAQAQSMAIPELTRVFGHAGVYLRPFGDMPAELSGNMLAQVVSLYRQAGRFDGSVRCLDAQWPFSAASLSLVYALLVLETSPEPEALMQEISRVLKPEGVALIVSLNPYSPARLRGSMRGARRFGRGEIERMVRDAGMEVVRRHFIGPFWASAKAPGRVNDGKDRWSDIFRAAGLLVVRRRESALTPLRKLAPAASLRPGMSAG